MPLLSSTDNVVSPLYTHSPRPVAITHNCLVPTGFSACTAPFSPEEMGCVYLNTERKTWCEARRACHALDADLAVPAEGDFNLLQSFLRNKAAGKCKFF